MEIVLVNKLKLLSFTMKNIDAVIERKKERDLNRMRKDLEKILEDVYSAKLAVLEEKIVAEEDQQNIDAWSSELDQTINKHEEALENINGALDKIYCEEEENKLYQQRREDKERAARMYEEQKQIEIMKLEIKKESEQKAAAKEKPSRAKLPKLEITKFKSTHIDWPRFWGQLEV